MSRLRPLSVTAVVVTYLQLTFGGIVRITGSGMGCGDHWPKCNGSWVPPFTDPTVMIEWTHRLLALLVLLSVGFLAVLARRAARAGDRVRVGLARAAMAGLALVIAVALLGALTVKLGTTALATVAHWTLAMALLAVLLAAAVRSGALGGDAARAQGGSARSARSLGAGAALALMAVVVGGLTAKSPGAAAACPAFPLCGDTPVGVPASGVTIQVTHRVLAFLLFFHATAIAVAIGRRAGESVVVRRMAAVAAGLTVLQVGLGGAMVLAAMPAWLRVSHQAVGVAVFMVLFLAAYLARAAHRGPRGAAGTAAVAATARAA